MYKRKTKDVFEIRWNGECVDSAETLKDARYLRQEYNLAFKGGVSIKKRREKIQLGRFAGNV